jgi:plastocyanin
VTGIHVSCVAKRRRPVSPLSLSEQGVWRGGIFAARKRYGSLKAILSMTRLMKPNRRKIHLMFASPIYNHRPKQTTRFERASSPFLRHLNTGTLAFFLLVALASLTNIRGREGETKASIPVEAGKTEIVIADFSFSPKTFTVPAGATVTWTNHDKVPHAVVSVDNQFQKSPVLKAGQTFSNTFATAGTYSYFCSIHPRMTGKIIVN